MDFNKCTFIGKAEDKPQIREGKQKQAFFNLIVNDRVQGANGQWVDRPITVPIYATDKKADIIGQYVVAGQELLIEGKYQSWKDGAGAVRHTITVYNVILGFKPRVQAEAQNVPDIGAPPM